MIYDWGVLNYIYLFLINIFIILINQQQIFYSIPVDKMSIDDKFGKSIVSHGWMIGWMDG